MTSQISHLQTSRIDTANLILVFLTVLPNASYTRSMKEFLQVQLNMIVKAVNDAKWQRAKHPGRTYCSCR